ncbi:MAG: M43 family zinc metalloprotease [Planctomycetota bacterium]
MTHTLRNCTLVIVLSCVAAVQAEKRSDLPGVQWTPSGQLLVGGKTFDSWADYASSAYFRTHGLRCGCGAVTPSAAPFVPGDCGLNNTNASAVYDPAVQYRIPVVVHVIQHANGTGYLSPAVVQSQIDILNQDFGAITGSNGAPGTDTGIEFFLAATDPQGNATTGITYTTNTQWFNDNGNYWNSLAWDPQRYLNIYTNTADGALGYVPFLPQEGPAGTNEDRVVVLYSTFGANAPMAPYNLGRTTTHEVGHFLGLWHTFDNGCGSVAACATTGDRICDTERQQWDTYGCPSGATSCGSADPIHNYMDYSDDQCMNNFTVHQTRRMRCTLESYRPLLFTIAGGVVPPVTGLSCTGGVGSVAVTWSNPAAYSEIAVERVGGVISMLPGTSTSFIDSSVPPGTHIYRVTGLTALGVSVDEECSVTVMAPGSASFRRGDANGDGNYDISDPVTILTVLFSSGVTTCAQALDANDDESVNVADPVYLLQALFGTGAFPSAPSPNCGQDPTPGPLTCASSLSCP